MLKSERDIHLKNLHECRRGYDRCIMPASTTGKNILPRAAALLRSQPITDVIAILSDTQFKRPIYAGNAIATVERICNATPLMLTIRPTSFEPAPQKSSPAPIESIHVEEFAVVEVCCPRLHIYPAK